jgi:hypothetical protein
MFLYLVNGRFGDPVLYVETLFEKCAILFDLSNLPPRKVQSLEHVFVSHAHINQFIGFDRLLRLLVGRERYEAARCDRISLMHAGQVLVTTEAALAVVAIGWMAGGPDTRGSVIIASRVS